MPKPTKKSLEGDAILFEGGFMSSKPMSWREPRTCVICGCQYVPNVARQKTCGKECSKAYNAEVKRAKSAEYWAKYKDKINAERGKYGVSVRPPKLGSHHGNKESAKEASKARIKRKRNMYEIARIAMMSNGDYGKWVALNDR